MAIERRDVEHVARLARLEMSDEELQTFTRHLARIVEYVDTLKRLDVSDCEPMMHAAEGALLRDVLDVGARDGHRQTPTSRRRANFSGSPASMMAFFAPGMSYCFRTNVTVRVDESNIAKAQSGHLSRGCPTEPGLIR